MHYRFISKVATGLLLLIAAVMMFGCSSDSTVYVPVPVGGGTSSSTPQLQSTIQKVEIPADGRPVVTFSLFDQNGQPLDPKALVAAGGRFQAYIGRLDSTDYYQNYFVNSSTGKPVVDIGTPAASQFTSLGNGQYTYRFSQSINVTPTPAGVPAYDPSKTHTIALQIAQQTVGSTGKAYTIVTNPYANFRPDGQPVTKTREVVSLEACNECHGSLGHHGGASRREIALCILCHNPQGEKTSGISALDFKSLVHKIHMGTNQKSHLAPYNQPNIAAGADYSGLAYPFWSADDKATKTPVKCVKCHRLGKDLAGRSYGKNVDLWKAAPTKANCETCHDTVFKYTGVVSQDHTGFTSATMCDGCHWSSASKYTSTAATTIPNAEGAHAILEETPSVFTGVNLQIISVTNSAAAGAGFIPTVSFKVTDNAGNPIDPRVASTVGRYALKLAYVENTGIDYLNSGLSSSKKFGQPTEFTVNNTSTGPVNDKGNGVYEITFLTGVPNGKSGVGVIGFDGGKFYPRVTLKYPTATTVRIYGKPVQYFFDLTTGARITDPALQRRKVVDVEKCKTCHYSLVMAHGGARSDTQYCVMCHNPNAARTATTATLPPVTLKSVDFKEMIHKVHDGVHYPQDIKNCLACHIDAASYGIPIKTGVFGNFTSPGYTGDQLNLPLNSMRKTPTAEVCSSCHVHVGGMSTDPAYVVNGVETCARCHTTGTALGADSAHKSTNPAPEQF